jgi:hypothetical protein
MDRNQVSNLVASQVTGTREGTMRRGLLCITALLVVMPALSTGAAYDIEDLATAVWRGNSAKVRQLLEKEKMDPNQRDNTLRTPLMIAVQNDQYDMALLLLEHGADPNVKFKGTGFTCLSVAASAGDLKMVRLLLKHGADPHIGDESGETPFVLAIRAGHARVARLLKEYGAAKDEFMTERLTRFCGSLLEDLAVHVLKLKVFPHTFKGKTDYGLVVWYEDRTPHGNAHAVSAVMVTALVAICKFHVSIRQVEAKPTFQGSDWRAIVTAQPPAALMAFSKEAYGSSMGKEQRRVLTKWMKTWEITRIDPRWTALDR